MYTDRRNQAWIPSIFGDLFDDFAVMPAKQFASPAVNIKETENDFQIEIAAPGMTKDDFAIRVDNEELVIALEKKHEHKDEKKHENYLRREFSYTSYHQAFTLPENIDVENIKANMTNGVLGIVLPKKTPEKQIPASRQIAIE